MKINHQKESFKPVIITLESQEEVDCLWGIMNHSWVVDTFGPLFNKATEDLMPYQKNGRAKFELLHERLEDKTKR